MRFPTHRCCPLNIIHTQYLLLFSAERGSHKQITPALMCSLSQRHCIVYHQLSATLIVPFVQYSKKHWILHIYLRCEFRWLFSPANHKFVQLHLPYIYLTYCILHLCNLSQLQFTEQNSWIYKISVNRSCVCSFISSLYYQWLAHRWLIYERVVCDKNVQAW